MDDELDLATAVDLADGYAARLRKKGHCVDLYPGAGKLGAQFKYADSKKARFALIIGPEESSPGKVKVKELATGHERTIGRDEEFGTLTVRGA